MGSHGSQQRGCPAAPSGKRPAAASREALLCSEPRVGGGGRHLGCSPWLCSARDLGLCLEVMGGASFSCLRSSVGLNQLLIALTDSEQ